MSERITDKDIEKWEKISIERVHKTEAYDEIEKYREWENEFLADKFEVHFIVNFIYPIIRKELKEKYYNKALSEVEKIGKRRMFDGHTENDYVMVINSEDWQKLKQSGGDVE